MSKETQAGVLLEDTDRGQGVIQEHLERYKGVLDENPEDNN